MNKVNQDAIINAKQGKIHVEVCLCFKLCLQHQT